MRLSNRLVVRFEEQIADMHTASNSVQETWKNTPCLGDVVGKEEAGVRPNSADKYQEVYVFVSKTGVHKNNAICGKGGRTLVSIPCKFKLDKYELKGHDPQDCLLQWIYVLEAVT